VHILVNMNAHSGDREHFIFPRTGLVSF